MAEPDTTPDSVPTGDPTDDGRDLALLVARTADDKKGDDVVVLDVGDVLAIAGYFVIVSASNSRLVESLANDIEAAAKLELDRPPVRTEGHREKQWVLIDYGDVVVHVFHKEMRDFYEIERLYGDVARIPWQREDRPQSGVPSTPDSP